MGPLIARPTSKDGYVPKLSKLEVEGQANGEDTTGSDNKQQQNEQQLRQWPIPPIPIHRVHCLFLAMLLLPYSQICQKKKDALHKINVK